MAGWGGLGLGGLGAWRAERHGARGAWALARGGAGRCVLHHCRRWGRGDRLSGGGTGAVSGGVSVSDSGTEAGAGTQDSAGPEREENAKAMQQPLLSQRLSARGWEVLHHRDPPPPPLTAPGPPPLTVAPGLPAPGQRARNSQPGRPGILIASGGTHRLDWRRNNFRKCVRAAVEGVQEAYGRSGDGDVDPTERAVEADRPGHLTLFTREFS
jgi:hypothetical protein